MTKPTEIQEPAENQPNHGDHGPKITPEATEPRPRSGDLRPSMNRGALQLGQAKAKRGLSNRDMASMLRVSPGLVSNWLNSIKKPTKGHRQRIAKTFGVAPEAFDQLEGPTTAEATGTLLAVRDLLSLPMGKRDRGRLVTIIGKLVSRA